RCPRRRPRKTSTRRPSSTIPPTTIPSKPKRAVMVDQPYSTAPQQREAATMGMFVFLGTEIMLFGGLFTVALGLRLAHPREFIEASKDLHVWIGAINTAVLLTSSAAVALAVHAGRAGEARATSGLLAIAALLGVAFLGIKAYEYASEYAE